MKTFFSGGQKSEVDKLSQIILRCKQGEREALGTLYEMYKKMIYNIAYRMTYNHADSEDIVQEVFLKVYQKIGSFHGEATFPSWLYRIAVNQSLSYWRRKGAVFVLHDIEGFTHQEIADIRKCSVGTSKSLLTKARLKMRRHLQPYISVVG